MLLKSPSWLNDAVIGFCFERFALAFEDHFSTSSNNNNPSSSPLALTLREGIGFISPATTQLMKMTISMSGFSSSSEDKEERNSNLQSMFGALNLEKKHVIFFFPLNDNSNPESVGGSHWTLLIVLVRERLAFYFDSSFSKSAMLEAESFLQGIAPSLLCCCVPPPTTNSSSSKNKKNLFEVQNGECPRQINGYDCGMYVITVAEIFVKSFLIPFYSSSSSSSCYDGVEHDFSAPMSLLRNEDFVEFKKKTLPSIVTPSLISSKRVFWLGLIKELQRAS